MKKARTFAMKGRLQGMIVGTVLTSITRRQFTRPKPDSFKAIILRTKRWARWCSCCLGNWPGSKNMVFHAIRTIQSVLNGLLKRTCRSMLKRACLRLLLLWLNGELHKPPRILAPYKPWQTKASLESSVNLAKSLTKRQHYLQISSSSKALQKHSSGSSSTSTARDMHPKWTEESVWKIPAQLHHQDEMCAQER